MPLCSNIDVPTDNDCTYDSLGNLDLEGVINPAMLIGSGVTGAQFYSALDAGRLRIGIKYDAGEAFGIFSRIF